jgi:hypothetical protein
MIDEVVNRMDLKAHLELLLAYACERAPASGGVA